MSSSYQLTTKRLDAVFSPSTLQLAWGIKMKLRLFQDAQHDGHPWGEDQKDRRTKELVEDIMKALRVEVEALVATADPFDIHA